MSTVVQAYEAALDALCQERAAAARSGRDLPVEIESLYVDLLDKLWWRMTNEEQAAHEKAHEVSP